MFSTVRKLREMGVLNKAKVWPVAMRVAINIIFMGTLVGLMVFLAFHVTPWMILLIIFIGVYLIHASIEGVQSQIELIKLYNLGTETEGEIIDTRDDSYTEPGFKVRWVNYKYKNHENKEFTGKVSPRRMLLSTKDAPDSGTVKMFYDPEQPKNSVIWVKRFFHLYNLRNDKQGT